MSLINEALKKAQRLRAEQTPHYTAPPIPGGTAPVRIPKRGRAMPAQTLVLIIGAAAVIIVLSVVITGYFLTRTPDPVVPHSPPKVASPVTDLNAPSPVIVAPVVTVPKPEPEAPAPAPAPVATKEPVPAQSNPPATKPAPATTTGPVAATTQPAGPATPKPAPVETSPREAAPGPATPVAPKPNAEVQAYVDSVRIAGVRFSGTDSKVLMNDRVYRVNDVVNYSLNLRLQKVAVDSVTFVDANGITYVKIF